MAAPTQPRPQAPPAVPQGATAMELPSTGSDTRELLFDLLASVIRDRDPDVEPALRGERLDRGGTPQRIARSLQALGVWSQLLGIADLQEAMRAQRRAEVADGPDRLVGTFRQVVADWRAANVPCLRGAPAARPSPM